MSSDTSSISENENENQNKQFYREKRLHKKEYKRRKIVSELLEKYSKEDDRFRFLSITDFIDTFYKSSDPNSWYEYTDYYDDKITEFIDDIQDLYPSSNKKRLANVIINKFIKYY